MKAIPNGSPPSGSEINEPRRFKYDLEAEPSDVEVPAFDSSVCHDYEYKSLMCMSSLPLSSPVGLRPRFSGGAPPTSTVPPRCNAPLSPRLLQPLIRRGILFPPFSNQG